MKLANIHEEVEFEDAYSVSVSGHHDQPVLEIPTVGFIRLFYTGIGPTYEVHMIRGERPGAGTILYFAALDWTLRHGIKDAHGQLASGSTLSPDAIRARANFLRRYSDYIYQLPHPDMESVKIHRGDNTDWRRAATEEEANMWRLKKEAPFEFNYG